MEDKELFTEEVTELPKKNKFIKFFTSRKFLIIFPSIVVFIVLEFTTDFVEIALGKVIELTNPFRPKSGTIWELNKKDQLANDQLMEITRNLPDNKNTLDDIQNLDELRSKLDEKQTVLISAEMFRNLYNQIPNRFTDAIISPFDLLKLSHSQKWTWTKIIKGENNLSFYFLDGDKQILLDTYPPLTVLYNIPHTDNEHIVSLDSMAMFQGRTITREQFFTVFDEFSNHVKLQLINNPRQLIKWDPNIRKVGVAKYSVDNTVLIGFEVMQGIYTEVYTFQASELAAEILIRRLNEIYPELNLDLPEKKYREYRYYYFQ